MSVCISSRTPNNPPQKKYLKNAQHASTNTDDNNNNKPQKTDPEVLGRAQTFLREAAENDATKAALVDLARHVAAHPETRTAVVELARWVVVVVVFLCGGEGVGFWGVWGGWF